MAIADQIKESVAAALRARGLNVTAADVALTIPPVKEHGDFSTNAALKSAKLLKLKPMQLAQDLVPELESSEVERVEAVAPGFLNFFMSQSDMASVVKKVLDEGSDFGSSPANGIKVDLEYVSANPTGYLHLGHARGAAVGDSLARIMRKAGYDVTREYYINDAGNQIDHMAESLIARYLQRLGHTEVEVPEDGYHGKDIVDIAEELYQDCGHEFENDAHDHLEFFRVYGTRKLLAKIILIPQERLYPVVLMMCTVGAYATLNGRMFDVWCLLVFGIVGLLIKKFHFPVSCFLIGFILGGDLEDYFIQVLTTYNGYLTGLFVRPMAWVIWALIILSVVYAVLDNRKAKRQAAEEAAAKK